ncbi:MAG: c-type cytochrome [Methylophilaceae bacterium]
MTIIIGLYSPIIVCAEESNTQASTFKSASMLLHVRTLAASCAACHGTDGNSVGSGINNHATATQNDLSHINTLAAIDKTDFIDKMQAFKLGQRPATVMHHHAKGLTSLEIEDLAEYFSRLPAHQATVLQPQPLLKDHGH